MKDSYRVLILGGGTGGISVTSRLRSHLGDSNIAIVDPSEFHYYQPQWTLVGAGLVKKERTRKPMSEVIPRGLDLFKDSVLAVDPISKTVALKNYGPIKYEVLVVATGLKIDFNKIKGVVGNLGTNGMCSIYDFEGAEQTSRMLESFEGGHAIFTMPPVPIKCAGAPQKIMYLADEIFRRNKVREKTEISFMVAGKVIFGIPKFALPLIKVAERKDIDVVYTHRLIEVHAKEKIAIFEKSVQGESVNTTETVSLPYNLLHVVPPMSAHDYITESNLAYTEGPHKGWLKVDPWTLAHQEFPSVFGIGDITGIPNSKTGAAIRKQAPVVAQNILSVLAGENPSARYDGYSSCPLITGHGKVILAEFGYDGKLMPSFPFDMSKERYSMWILKRFLLPKLYWKTFLKGWL